MLYAGRSHARLMQEQFIAALHDANKCLHLKPRVAIGYIRKFEALYSAKDYDGVLETLSIGVKDARARTLDMSTPEDETEVSVLRWRNPDEVAVNIHRVVEALTLEMPPRLFNTFTGQLCERNDVLGTFKKSDAYKHLLILVASGRAVDQTIIQSVKYHFQYVMLSHRWDTSHPEPSKQDIIADVYSLTKPKGVKKLKQFCRTAAKLGFEWAWSDTCCIDKSNSTEAQKSITSMATWYRRSALTIVHLADVPGPAPELFERSDWFTRGWTLQELLTPPKIRFYKSDWTPLLEGQGTPFNHKEHEPTLDRLTKATGIDKGSLRRFTPSCNDVRERLRWASHRRTTEEEDIAYSLMGVFDLQIPVMYGELKQKALGRLLQEIVGSSGDLSVLQWSGTSGSFSSCLPADISAFQEKHWKSPRLAPDDIARSIKRLRQKVAEDLNNIPSLQRKLRKYHPAPLFMHGRLTLTCFVHHVKDFRRVVKRGSPRESGLYDVWAQGLKPFQVTVESTEHLSTPPPLRNQHDFVVIRPWNPDFHNGFTPDAGGDPERLALEACVQLERPFYALLLSRRRSRYYRRVAGAVVKVGDIMEVLRTISIERLEIF
ncbi:hypothetical protein F5I97DRAFT_37737 [Phlebopus sp. FC_14]|nr:hypothetical protein F5I97DRAFT_37737 [Phlebopus sp. FC_14]